MTPDTSIFFALNNLAGRSHTLDLLIVFLAEYLAYIAVAVFLIAVWRARERKAIFWVPVISAAIARLGITQIIRLAYHRPRPFLAYNVHQLLSDTAWSFPSGHATFFFALATGVWFYDKKWGTVLFAAAILITVARVIAGVHYPSDILAGMLIGVATAYGVYCIARRPKRTATPS